MNTMAIRRNTPTIALLIGLTVIAATSAMAGIVSYSTSTPIAYSTTDWINSLAFAKFNTSLGVLTRVDMQIDTDIQTIITVKSNSPLSQVNGHASINAMVTKKYPNALLNLKPNIYNPYFYFSLAQGETATSGLLSKSDSDFESYFDAPILAEFTGAGDISIDVDAFANSSIYGSSNIITSIQTHTSATGTVTYYYDETPPVPEPASLLAALSILGPAGLMFRRRSNRAVK